MASTRTRNLARAIQRANPDMKYTEALRNAEAGRIVFDPRGSYEALLEIYQAAGMDITPIAPSPSARNAPLDPFPPAGRNEDTEQKLQDLAPVLWDGETHPDPLTFLVGQDLGTGEDRHLTLNGTTPHLLISGGTASGKTGIAEIIAAQAVMKAMPWDSDLRGSAVIVDPKGPLARRWAGRPGVIVANGQEDAAEPDEKGNPITGSAVMASAMEWVKEEYQRRQAVMTRRGDIGSWLDLPDAVKREEQFAPMIVILDEYLDHTLREDADDNALDSALIEKENTARETVINLVNSQARKYRSVGIHTVLVSQKIAEAAIGSSLMGNLPGRVMTGQVNNAQLRGAFGEQDIPELPSTREVDENGEQKTKVIPGRARIMSGLGSVETIQAPWFGGNANIETLNKWLPRGETPPNGDFTPPTGKPRKAH